MAIDQLGTNFIGPPLTELGPVDVPPPSAWGRWDEQQRDAAEPPEHFAARLDGRRVLPLDRPIFSHQSVWLRWPSLVD